MIHNIDIAPTIMRILGVTPAATVNGGCVDRHPAPLSNRGASSSQRLLRSNRCYARHAYKCRTGAIATNAIARLSPQTRRMPSSWVQCPLSAHSRATIGRCNSCSAGNCRS